MQTLQKAMEEALGKAPELVLAHILAPKLKSLGLHLSKKEERSLVDHVLAGRTQSLSFRSWRSSNQGQDDVIEFTAEDLEKIGEIGKKVEAALPDIIESAGETLATSILDTLKKRWPRESGRQKKEFSGFRKRLHERWGPGIEGLRMLVTVSREYGASINEETHANAPAGRGYLADVLLRLHARSCLVVGIHHMNTNSGRARDW